MTLDMLLKIETVEGESQIKGHEKEIDVLSWSWDMTQSASMHFGSGGGAGKVDIQDIRLTKYVDKSSPVLLKYCCNGKRFNKATLTVRKPGNKPFEYFKINMEPLLISSISIGGQNGEDRLTEIISLNFGKFEVIYTPQKPDGSGDAEIRQKWNIATNAES
jgi:type VI secretion system secreted protein Hcp